MSDEGQRNDAPTIEEFNSFRNAKAQFNFKNEFAEAFMRLRSGCRGDREKENDHAYGR
jgi:hypothetical protein